MSLVEGRLKALDITLPEVAAPAGVYVPAKRVDTMVYTSGQLPFADGKLLHPGVLGADVTVEQGYEAARQCALNALAALKSVIGDFDRIEDIVKVTGFVASAPGFTEQPAVINGASEIIGELFGKPAGDHARSAVGVAALPLGSCVEVEIQARFRMSATR
ncbi:RidA family protein [Brevibacterium sp. 50QC2O2]|jgi:enamine deaminase RidA (YjgF/YER057c/UK114 family)|uniref:RidA family protein n=1 Tax=unclassified Brevibacterium TaxID=2614124 RepID=UPI00211D0623|nr:MULTISPECIES: RidA family protein [unclassified Brevibacterium]MCQ9368601.1 RidA family protein [Brevibacterium sp. 91QC2O2]MCQ9387208.1 RidA family protein [Brevibacterium sp. 50QC2O2]